MYANGGDHAKGCVFLGGAAGAVQTPLTIMMAVLSLQHFLVWRLSDLQHFAWVHEHTCNP